MELKEKTLGLEHPYTRSFRETAGMGGKSTRVNRFNRNTPVSDDSVRDGNILNKPRTLLLFIYCTRMDYVDRPYAGQLRISLPALPKNHFAPALAGDLL